MVYNLFESFFLKKVFIENNQNSMYNNIKY